MASPVLILRDTQLTFGGTPLLTGADLQVGPQDRICLVGRNGSGKSTLLKIAAGLVEPDAGERFVQPGVDIAYLPQEPDLTAHETVGAYVDAGFAEGQSTHRGYAMLDALGVDPARHPGTLSGGEGRRAALARTLAPAPRVLLLDEPTNHLDLPTIEWLETTLDGNRGALVLISHDRRFLEKLSRRTVWLDRGTCRTLDKGFAAFEDWRDTVFETEAEDAHKLARRIAREEHWMQGGVSGRRKRNMRRVGELQRMRETQRTALAKPGSVRFEASEAEASGKLVIEARGVSKGYDSAAPVVRDVSIRIARGDRLGIVGANGAGKTTLVKLLTGRLDPDEGSVRQGANVEVLWLDQARGDLDDNATLTDVLTGGRGDTVMVNGKPRHVATYLKDFLFLPEQARSPVSALSGGERARLLLARALALPSNLMVLDEPTNDLDLETLDLLQELLADYAGTLIIVSHDRDFLDRTCQSILANDGDGGWTQFAGGYSDMRAQRDARDGERETPQPMQSEPRPRTATQSEPAKPARPQRQQTKLSFKDKHALETLPARIEALETDIARHSETLADTNLFSRDPAAFEAATTALTKAQTELANAEEQWLELEMRREELEG